MCVCVADLNPWEKIECLTSPPGPWLSGPLCLLPIGSTPTHRWMRKPALPRMIGYSPEHARKGRRNLGSTRSLFNKLSNSSPTRKMSQRPSMQNQDSETHYGRSGLMGVVYMAPAFAWSKPRRVSERTARGIPFVQINHVTMRCQKGFVPSRLLSSWSPLPPFPFWQGCGCVRSGRWCQALAVVVRTFFKPNESRAGRLKCGLGQSGRASGTGRLEVLVRPCAQTCSGVHCRFRFWWWWTKPWLFTKSRDNRFFIQRRRRHCWIAGR